MCDWNTIIVPEKTSLALQRLEFVSDQNIIKIIEQLGTNDVQHLPELSKALAYSPFLLKKKLDKLKKMGLVYAPKRYPNAYMLNQFKWVKIQHLAKLIAVE